MKQSKLRGDRWAAGLKGESKVGRFVVWCEMLQMSDHPFEADV